MKITKKDITTAMANTPDSLADKNIRAMNSVLLGYFTPKDANWSWELHAISVEDKPMIVAARFGYIVK